MKKIIKKIILLVIISVLIYFGAKFLIKKFNPKADIEKIDVEQAFLFEEDFESKRDLEKKKDIIKLMGDLVNGKILYGGKGEATDLYTETSDSLFVSYPNFGDIEIVRKPAVKSGLDSSYQYGCYERVSYDHGGSDIYLAYKFSPEINYTSKKSECIPVSCSLKEKIVAMKNSDSRYTSKAFEGYPIKEFYEDLYKLEDDAYANIEYSEAEKVYKIVYKDSAFITDAMTYFEFYDNNYDIEDSKPYKRLINNQELADEVYKVLKSYKFKLMNYETYKEKVEELENECDDWIVNYIDGLEPKNQNFICDIPSVEFLSIFDTVEINLSKFKSVEENASSIEYPNINLTFIDFDIKDDSRVTKEVKEGETKYFVHITKKDLEEIDCFSLNDVEAFDLQIIFVINFNTKKYSINTVCSVKINNEKIGINGTFNFLEKGSYNKDPLGIEKEYLKGEVKFESLFTKDKRNNLYALEETKIVEIVNNDDFSYATGFIIALYDEITSN